MKRLGGGRALASIVSVVGCVVCVGAFAQTAVGPNGAEEGLRRQEERERELQRQLETRPDVLTPSQGGELSFDLPDESPCFVIHDIELTGAGARFHWLEDTAQAFVGQCVGVKGLRHIATVLDARLIQLGYATTRVSLPQQNLSSGRLAIQVHVGRISAVRMVRAGGNEPDVAWGTWWNAFPLSAGEVLNVRDLEQGVEQMKRLPTQSVATRIEPGEAPDTSVIVIERQQLPLKDRIRGGVTVDNSGGSALGRTQWSGNLALDNPLGLSDVLSMTASTNGEHIGPDHRSQSASASYSVPFGYHTFSVSKSYSRYAQVVQGTTVEFLSSGKSETTEARWSMVALRTSSSKTGIYAALSTRRSNSYLDDVELLVQRRKTTNFEIGGNFKYLFGNASIDLEVGYRQGVPWQHAQDDFDSAVDGGLTLRPRLWTYSASFFAPFSLAGRPLQYSLTVRGQQTSALTTSTDQFSIGSRYTVRGFDGDVVLMAENGYVIRNDLSMPVLLVDGLDTVFYLGLDAGRVWGPSGQYIVGNELVGTALGVRGRFRQFQADFSIGKPLSKPEGFRTRDWTPYLSLTYAF
ncbi:ShlB/FhaC/HecB family hemolysin secretion/activation protein [Uliginosibacterium sp. sgz301328]|uniref:ShlB/FhaC/HecB family hemolysin secretion/activation protein n=1 Tax=Uliginosibacterium sp. sgz301328 TaxID=3243764 RepID=UPI00359E19D8